MRNQGIRSLVVTTAALCGLVAAALCWGIAPAAAQVGVSAAALGRPAYVPNQVLVQFRSGVTPTQRSQALAHAAASALEHIETDSMKAHGAPGIVLAAARGSVPDTIRVLQSLPGVAFAEPNWIYTHQDTSNDPYYTNGSLWGMYGNATSPANQYGSQAGEAWANNHLGSSGVYVGVIDEGIQFTHPDLLGQVWTNPFDPLDGVDNDGNGLKDDVHGWDFANNDNSIYDGGTSGKLDAHGTHVAGTIGAIGGNGIGVAGVNWNVTIISAKFLGRSGGTTANAIKAVDYITNLKTRHGLNIVATNNSWGGGGFSQGLLDAINRGLAANILFICAAGNGGGDGVGDNNDLFAYYPANYNSAAVIAVAAITSTGAKASFSNYGASTVDLGAPGQGVVSTVAYNKYASYSGTSMATPHVTGAAALYASTHPSATAAEIKKAILSSTVPTAALSGKTVTGGRLNVSGF